MAQHKGNAKLTPKDVLEIRRLRGEGWTIAALARGFRMSGNQIGKICDGTAWGHISQGTEVITNAEGQLRQLTQPGPTSEEVAASQERLLRLLAVNEDAEKRDIPEQYRGLDTSDPEEYRRKIQEIVDHGKERTQHNGPPPPPVPVRYPVHEVKETAAVNAAQLLETLKHVTNQDPQTEGPKDPGAVRASGETDPEKDA